MLIQEHRGEALPIATALHTRLARSAKEKVGMGPAPYAGPQGCAMHTRHHACAMHPMHALTSLKPTIWGCVSRRWLMISLSTYFVIYRAGCA